MAEYITTFHNIVNNILGAEGPVFDNEGNFFMVAPEVEKNGKPAGQILKIDVNSGKVKNLNQQIFFI